MRPTVQYSINKYITHQLEQCLCIITNLAVNFYCTLIHKVILTMSSQVPSIGSPPQEGDIRP